MGLMKEAIAEKNPNTMPFFLKTGKVGPCDLVGISVMKPADAEKPIFTFNFVPQRSAVPSCKNPLEIPTLTWELNCNRPEHLAVVYGLIGEPSEVNGGVVWDTSGYFEWNGKVDTEFHASGSCDLSVELLKPPAPKRNQDGYWDARYRVNDADPPGTAQKQNQEAMASLTSIATPKPTEAPTDKALNAAATSAKPAGGRRGAGH